MKRTLAVLAAICLVAVSLAAQAAPKKVLSGKDIEAFIANFDGIERDMDALGEKYDEYFEAEDQDGTASPSMIIAQMRARKVPEEVKAILKKHGLGDNGFEKIIVISAGFGALEMDSSIVAQEQEYADYPEMAGYLDQAKQQTSELKASIHKDDLSLISARSNELRTLFDEESEE